MKKISFFLYPLLYTKRNIKKKKMLNNLSICQFRPYRISSLEYKYIRLFSQHDISCTVSNMCFFSNPTNLFLPICPTPSRYLGYCVTPENMCEISRTL